MSCGSLWCSQCELLACWLTKHADVITELKLNPARLRAGILIPQKGRTTMTKPTPPKKHYPAKASKLTNSKKKPAEGDSWNEANTPLAGRVRLYEERDGKK